MLSSCPDCTWTCVQMPVRPKEGARCPAAGVIGSCEPPNKGAGNKTPVFCKRSKHTEPMKPFPQPKK